MPSQTRKTKVKWTEPMNKALLDCKRRAKELVSSENPPCNENGKKRGYMYVMKEIWDSMGYAHLNLTSGNLRDQSSKLEKAAEKRAETSTNVTNNDNQPIDNSLFNQEYASMENHNIRDFTEEENANFSVLDMDLHMTEEQSEEVTSTTMTSLFAVPGDLPSYKGIERPSTVEWSTSNDGKIITINSSVIEDAYNEITKWRKNVFLVPYGKTGRDFIDQLTKHIDDWNNNTKMQHIALKATMVLLVTALQKPSRKSKAKDHQECLEKRLALWRRGEIDCLLREGRAIQRRLTMSSRKDHPDKARIFAKLVMEGQINSALRYLSEEESGGVLPLTDNVMQQLRDKHPEAQDAELGTLVFGPVQDTPDVIYQQINGEMIRDAALRTKGSGGPSGIDANGFKRILASKSFKKSGTALCESLATLTRKLCTETVDPLTIEPLLANRLIPLDKGNGEVRPIGVGEVIRRVIAKCVLKVLKQDVVEASGALQVCAGQRSGSEAAVHAMRNIFEADDTDAALLVDASNAFNSLNRAAALHNIRILCPTIAMFAINTYRAPARLFVIGGMELRSSEGTTQGDPLSMSIYAIGVQPLITMLAACSSTTQCWYADDATGAGALDDVRSWWDHLVDYGPLLGYHPNAKKCWLVVKPDKEEAAKAKFAGTAINITTEGRKHLGAALGSREYLEDYVGSQVTKWADEVTSLAKFAISQPQASYAAFTFGLRHRWTYFMRTLPDIDELLGPLEHAISQLLIPSLTEHTCSEVERELMALPVRMGGLGITNPCKSTASEYTSSIRVSGPLVEEIMKQSQGIPDEADVREVINSVRKEKEKNLEGELEKLKLYMSDKTLRCVELAREKGASNWLTVIPLKDMDFDLNKREFRDAIRLRYDWSIPDSPSICVCGCRFSVDHAMICQRGGLIIQRHNAIRDLEAELLDMVCYDVEIEPSLQPVTGEELNNGSNRAPDARLDVHCRGFWERQRAAFFDVRVCHPNADSYRDLTPKQIYNLHESEKKRKYGSRITEVEQGTFTPLVFTTTGGMAPECQRFHTRLAELLSNKKKENYGTTISWLRAKVSFAILRSALLCLRGSRSARRKRTNVQENDIDIDVGRAGIH